MVHGQSPRTSREQGSVGGQIGSYAKAHSTMHVTYVAYTLNFASVQKETEQGTAVRGHKTKTSFGGACDEKKMAEAHRWISWGLGNDISCDFPGKLTAVLSLLVPRTQPPDLSGAVHIRWLEELGLIKQNKTIAHFITYLRIL